MTATWKKDFFPLFVCLFLFYFFFAIRNFFHPLFSIRIFPSASAIRRYPVRVLQTPLCLFVYFYFIFFLPSGIFSIRFFLSAFFYPHFPIRIRHPQISGPRFTDTRSMVPWFIQVSRLVIASIFCHTDCYLGNQDCKLHKWTACAVSKQVLAFTSFVRNSSHRSCVRWLFDEEKAYQHCCCFRISWIIKMNYKMVLKP